MSKFRLDIVSDMLTNTGLPPLSLTFAKNNNTIILKVLEIQA